MPSPLDFRLNEHPKSSTLFRPIWKTSIVRAFRVVFSVIICAFSAPPSFANCEVIALLETMHGVEQRIAQAEDDSQAAVAFLFLWRGIALITEQDVPAAVGPENAAAFDDFLGLTQKSLRQFEFHGAAAAQAYLQTQSVRNHLKDIAVRLSELRCAPAPDIRQEPASEAPGTNLSGVPLNFSLSRNRILAALLGLLLFALATIAIVHRQARTQRRAKRYLVHHKTNYQTADGTYDGVLLDISGAGIKLQHDPLHPLKIGAKIAVQIQNQWVRGTIQWANPNYSGLLLSPPMRARQVLKFVRAQSRPQNRKRRPQRDAV